MNAMLLKSIGITLPFKLTAETTAKIATTTENRTSTTKSAFFVRIVSPIEEKKLFIKNIMQKTKNLPLLRRQQKQSETKKQI